MSGPFSLLGSDASPKASEEKSDIKKEVPTPNSPSKVQQEKSTPPVKDSCLKDHVNNTPKEKEVSIPNQPQKPTTHSTLSTQPTQPTQRPESKSSSSPTSKPTSKTASTPTHIEEDEEEDLSDFEGSDLSDLSSVSSGDDLESDSSLDEDDSNKDSEEDSSSDDQPKRTKKKGSSGNKARAKNNRRIQSDSSSDDDRRIIAVKRKPGRPPKSKSNNPGSPTIHRPSKGPTEDAEMEDVVSPTSESPRKKGKQPDFANIGKRDRSGRTQLFKYTALGDLETCRLLIDAGAQVNDRDNAKWTPLHEACVTGHDKVAELLIQHHAEINAQGGQLDTPLHDAAQNGHVDVVKLLLANGANVLAKNKHGVIPIDVADDKEVVDLLQRRQTQVNMLTRKNQAGQTLLHQSCSSGSYSNVVDLVDQGADINAQDNAQWTPLHEAALAGHTKVVEFLLSRGADPNAMGHGDDTALHDASQNEHEDVVRLLLEYGADPHLKNSKGEKPCDVCEDDDILDLLKSGIKATKKITPVASPSISSGSSLSSLSSHSSKTSTPTHSSPFLGHKKSDSSKLLRRREGSDMSDDGRSASEDRPTQGQMSRDERKMQQLLSTIRMQEQMEERKKAKKRRPKQATDDEDMEDNKSNTRPSSASNSSSWKSSPHAKRSDSHSSSRIHASGNDSRRRSSRSVGQDESGSEAEKGRGRRSVQRSLSDRFRIDHRYKDSAGRTQLHQWAEAGDLEMVGTLLEGGADRNPVDQDGVTPLHLAAKAGNTEVLTLLLAYGCNINTQDHDKATALHEAVRHHHSDAVRMLLQNNARLSLRDSRKRTCLDLASSKDTEIKALLKQALEQAEKNKEKSKKRVSQVMDAHNLPKTKERKTSRLSDSDESERPSKSKSKEKMDDRKSTISKSISMPSISLPQPMATPSPSSNPSKSTSTAATGPKSSWTGEREDGVIAPLKKKLHSRKSSSGMADDDVDMQSGSSKKRRDIDRPADPFGGKVKIKKEREEESPSRPQGITAKAEELRRVASTPYLKDSSSPHRPTFSRSSSSTSKPGLHETGRPNSLPSMGPTSSSVASMSPPLTETSSSSTSPPPPAQPPSQVSSVQEQELNLAKSRKRNSQTFSSPSGYLKFADDLKLGSMTTTSHSRSASTTARAPAPEASPATETEVSRKKAKTTLEPSVSSETKSGSKEPRNKETPPTSTSVPTPTGSIDVSPPTSESNKPHVGRQVAPPEPSPAPEIKQEPIEVKPSMRSVQDAQRYLPLYTVQLSGDVEETTTTTNSKYVSSNGMQQQHFCVVDRQVQLLLGLRPGSLFLRYPHLYRRMVTKREKARLWSPLSSMVSDRCAAAVKFSYEILPAECHPFSTTTAMSRLKEHEKQKFLGCDLYFIRLEEVIEVIKKDYGQLNESMMTITLDIGYDEAEMEVDDSDEDTGGVVKTEITESSSAETLKAAVSETLKPIKKEGDGEERVFSEPMPQRPVFLTPHATAPSGGYIHKLRRVPAKMAAKAMFKEMLQSQYRTQD
ncbi:hypothetical protein BGZ74_011750 [Mortierella antarctica]|nr:hypothetical protein BGZ74_011750 [Mortierella antarctica]